MTRIANKSRLAGVAAIILWNTVYLGRAPSTSCARAAKSFLTSFSPTSRHSVGSISPSTAITSGQTTPSKPSGHYEILAPSSSTRLSVYSGAVDSSSYVASGGKEYVSAGADDYFTTIASGGVLSAKGFVYETTISKGGTQTILSGGSEDNAQVYGNEKISAGGLGYGDTVFSGGAEDVYNAAVTSGAIISSGGKAIVSAGGTFTSGTLRGGP